MIRFCWKFDTKFESFQELLENTSDYVGPIVVQPFLWAKLIIISCNNNFGKKKVPSN